jgi:hypothetical protein
MAQLSRLAYGVAQLAKAAEIWQQYRKWHQRGEKRKESGVINIENESSSCQRGADNRENGVKHQPS